MMRPMSNENTPETVYQGRFLQVMKRGRWEYATRVKATGVVAVVALHDDGRVVLVEQHRPPADGSVLELPAGLAGDTDQTETLLDAAKRELEEETGYTAAHWQPLTTGFSSAGLTDERVTFFRATGLTKSARGGGVDGEDIAVHEVPLAELMPWLQSRTGQGVSIALTLLAGVYAASEIAGEESN